MVEKYEIKERRDGFYTKFKHNNHNYVADIILIKVSDLINPDAKNITPFKNCITECAIFEELEDNSYSPKPVFRKRRIDVSEENLIKCIEEFKKGGTE